MTIRNHCCGALRSLAANGNRISASIGNAPRLNGLSVDRTAAVSPMPPELTGLAGLLRALLRGRTLYCTEKLHSRPGQSSQSTFTFGERYGEIHGICAAIGLELIEVDPKVWQSLILGQRGETGTKAASINHCRKTYPHVSLIPPGGRVPSDGMADALCIAEYAYRRSNG